MGHRNGVAYGTEGPIAAPSEMGHNQSVRLAPLASAPQRPPMKSQDTPTLSVSIGKTGHATQSFDPLQPQKRRIQPQ